MGISFNNISNSNSNDINSVSHINRNYLTLKVNTLTWKEMKKKITNSNVVFCHNIVVRQSVFDFTLRVSSEVLVSNRLTNEKRNKISFSFLDSIFNETIFGVYEFISRWYLDALNERLSIRWKSVIYWWIIIEFVFQRVRRDAERLRSRGLSKAMCNASRRWYRLKY